MPVSPNSEPDLASIDLTSLRVIGAVARCGSITLGARDLGMTQPAVSQHLRRLESRIGVAVTVRAGRGIRLTEAGTILARHSVSVAETLKVASEEIAAVKGLHSGSVRIAAFPTGSSTFIPELLGQLAAGHHELTVNYIEAEPPEAIDAVRAGTVDLAVTFSYPGDGLELQPEKSAGIRRTALWEDDMLLVTSDSHRLAGRERVKLADLADENWIAGCFLCRGHLVTACRGVGFTPTIIHETDNLLATVNMVASGLGIAMVPNLALAGITLPGQVVVLPVADSTARTISIVTSPDAQRIPSTALSIDLLRRLDPKTWSMREHAPQNAPPRRERVVMTARS